MEMMNSGDNTDCKVKKKEKVNKRRGISMNGLILKIDAAWKENKAGYGFACFSEGTVIIKGKGVGLDGSSLQAEGQAMWFGLDNVKRKGLKEISIFSDNEMLIKILTKEIEPAWKIARLIDRILCIAMEVNVIAWNHCKREINEEAHQLAAEAWSRLKEEEEEEEEVIEEISECGIMALKAIIPNMICHLTLLLCILAPPSTHHQWSLVTEKGHMPLIKGICCSRTKTFYVAQP
ncbi:hypothetical protein Cni_G02465 [Canna indica]|uniref:RNase H type-1 domain-containing protein n=1 Tax=Canna indica TaxID=4628 RepID=A0AAQ3JRB1_9LILI|nr:hypothetical protein Cni_G02465 [Canna indica]